MRIGIFLPNWIGDVVMATPTLRAMRRQFPAAHITGIMRPYVASVLEGTGWFDDTWLYEKGGANATARGSRTAGDLRAAKLDQVVLLTNSFRTAWIAWRSGVPERIGYVGDFRRWLLTRRLPIPRDGAGGNPRPTIDAYLALASALGCPAEPPRMELATTAADEQAATAAWRRLGLPPGERVIVLNSGGAFGAAKSWPAEHFAALARRLAETGYGVLVNSGPKERQQAQEIVARSGHPQVKTLAELEELPVGLTKACIRRARMLVTTDSGPRFFGIAFGKPVVTLFGPTSPAATVTHYNRETCLTLSLDCQPCMARTCPLVHHRCMRDLSVEGVFGTVAARLGDDFVRGADCAADRDADPTTERGAAAPQPFSQPEVASRTA